MGLVKTLTANSVVIMDDHEGVNKQFFEGDEFDTDRDAHLLAKMGDHLFQEKPAEEPKPAEVDLHAMKVPDLLELAMSLDVEPKSNRKADLIEAIEAATSGD